MAFGGGDKSQGEGMGFLTEVSIDKDVLQDTMRVAFGADFDHLLQGMKLDAQLLIVGRIGAQENSLAYWALGLLGRIHPVDTVWAYRCPMGVA